MPQSGRGMGETPREHTWEGEQLHDETVSIATGL